MTVLYRNPCYSEGSYNEVDDKPRALAIGYSPYTRTNHTLTCLLHI